MSAGRLMATLYSWQLTFCAITRSLYLMWQKLSCSVFSLKCPVCCVTRDTSSQYAGQSSVQMSTIFYSKSLYQIETETNLMKLYQMGPGGNNPILLLTSIALQTFPSLSLSGRAKHFFTSWEQKSHDSLVVSTSDVTSLLVWPHHFTAIQNMFLQE